MEPPLKKYLRLSCTVCKREIDKLVDLTHYTPDKCTITLGCEGRLQQESYRSSGGIAVTPEIGVTDWRPRGSTSVAGVSDRQSDLINLETGKQKQLVLAIALADVPSPNDVATLNATVKSDSPKAYRQYVFRKEGAFGSVSGVESGLEKKSLRFTAYGPTGDKVEVFVNGVLRERGTNPDDYQIYDGSDGSAAPPNSVVFNTVLDSQSSTQVDVIVSKEAVASSVTLTFLRNLSDESRNASGSWENVSYVERLFGGIWKRYYLFTLDLGDIDVPLNTLMSPHTMDAFFLLARKPYSQLDRYTDTVVLLQGLSDADYIKYYVEDNENTARVTSTALSTFFPPLRVGKFVVEKTIRTQIAGVEEQLVIDGRVITGPDA